jgi:hypothetical protein
LSATESIGSIEKNSDIFILTYGQFSLIDALMAILDQTGPAHVSISTWTAASAHLDRSAELLATAKILSFRMIVDRSFQSRQPGYYAQMQALFGPETVRAIQTHAKFIVVRNDEWNVVVRTSMNLNQNPRLENIEISEDKEFADFFERLVDNVFDEVPENTNKSGIPTLSEMTETPLFKIVNAKQIQRESLHEAKATHTVKSR